MKACKIIFNIFGILLAIVFSLSTFTSLIAAPTISAGTSLLQPDTLQQILQNMNLSEQLEQVLKESAPEDLQKLDMKFIDDLMGSELISDILQIYIDNMVGILENDHMESINQQQIRSLLTQHSPALVTMLRPYLPTDIPLSDEDISSYAHDMLEPVLLTMISSLPSLEDMGIDSTTLTLIHMLYNGSLLKCSFAMIGIFSALVFLCRFPRFKGFMWLGIIYLLSAIVLLLATGNINSFVDTLVPEQTKSYISFALEPIIALFKGKFTTYGRNLIILSAVFIVLFIIGRVLLSLKKRSIAQEQAA